jgi:hypothetical protein
MSITPVRRSKEKGDGQPLEYAGFGDQPSPSRLILSLSAHKPKSNRPILADGLLAGHALGGLLGCLSPLPALGLAGLVAI